MPSPGEIIAHDLPCVRCGYNLRGLAVTKQCPECHADVNASVVRAGLLRLTASAPSLAEADPVLAGGIVTGMWLLAGTILIQLLLPLIDQIVTDPPTRMLAVTSAMAACWACFVGGVWRLTRHNTDLDAAREVWHARLSVLAYAAFSFVQLFPRTPTGVMIVRGIVGVYATLFVYRCLAPLAQRLPSRALVTMCYIATPVFALMTLGSAAIGAPGRLPPPMTFGPWEAVGRELVGGGGFARYSMPILVLTIAVATLGNLPLFFLLIWYTRSKRGERGLR